jgi:hypothetical protein
MTRANQQAAVVKQIAMAGVKVAIGTNAECRPVRSQVAIGGKAENIGSLRAFRIVTLQRHEARIGQNIEPNRI